MHVSVRFMYPLYALVVLFSVSRNFAARRVFKEGEGYEPITVATLSRARILADLTLGSWV